MNKRLLSLLLAATMITSMFNTVALAANTEEQKTEETQIVCEICGHEHDETCGYVEAVEGQPCTHIHDENCEYAEGTEGSPCTHEHTDECYSLVTNCVHEHTDECYPLLDSGERSEEPSNCVHQCSEENGCIMSRLHCQHEHSDECGYVAPTEGVPYNHEHTAECGYIAAVEARGCHHECVAKEPLTPLTPVAMDTTEKAAVTETCKLTISYFFKDSSKMLAPDYIAVLPKDSEYTVISPIILGFAVIDETQSQINGELSEDTSIVVYYDYSKNTAVYKVNYYIKNNGSSENILEESQEKHGLIDGVINVEDKKIAGYQRLAADMTLTITADGKAEKNLYYVQNTNPYIVFNTNGSYVEPITAVAGTDISAQVDALPTPTRDGYAFDGWSEEVPTTMPENDLILEAAWIPATSVYHVFYWFQNATNDEYTLNKGLDAIRNATTESTVSATQEDKDFALTDDKTSAFYGFDYSHCDEVRVNGDGKSVLNIYYNREIWTINLYNNPVRYETSPDEFKGFERQLWKAFSGRYGAPVPADYPSVQEQIDYYSALNPWTELATPLKYVNTIDSGASTWVGDTLSKPTFFSAREFTSESNVGTHIEEAYPYYADKSNTFNILYYGQSLDASSYELLNTRVVQAQYSTANLNAYPLKGFTWQEGSLRTGAAQSECEAKNWTDLAYVYPDGKVYVNIMRWTEMRMQRVKNLLTYQSNGESTKEIDDVYYQTPIDLLYIPDNAPENCHFGGWYLNPDDFDFQEPLSQYEMPHTATTLYAKWAPKDVTVTFESNGGTAVPSQTLQIGGKAARPTNPTLQDGEFGGWYTSEGDRWIFDREVPSDMILYARWNATPMADYGIYHLMQEDNAELKAIEGAGHIGDIYLASAMGRDAEDYREGIYLEADAVVKSLVLKNEAARSRAILENNKVTFFYKEGGVRDYTVSYYKQGTTEKLAEDKIVIGTKLSAVTEFAETIAAYVANESYKVAELQTNAENHIIFYYRAEGDVPTPTKYTVIYNANGGQGEAPAAPTKYEEGTTVSVLDNTFINSGNQFIGWKDGEGNNYAVNNTFSMPAKDVTLFAQWSKNSTGGGTNYYTLSYEPNGGTEYKDERHSSGTTVKLDKVPSRTGYAFTGWYADKALTEKITEIKMNSSKTVYAGWRTSTVPDMLNGDDHFAYVVGYTDGLVRPLNNITRAEVATIFFRLLKDDVRGKNLTATNTFTDVVAGTWCNKPISTMATLGVVKGRSDQIFDPEAAITRAEFATICARFDTTVTNGNSNFTDISGHWAQADIERAATLGWIQGYTDGTFRPEQYITRAEAMTMINRVLCRIPENEDDLLQDMVAWPDNQPGVWYYLAVQEATNGHDYTPKGEVYERWTKLIAAPDWTKYEN